MKKKINTYILLGVILAVQLFAVYQWIPCHGFADNFHFSSFDLGLRLIESIHTDQNTPLWMVRFFHNKADGTIFDIFGTYLQLWNLSFLAVFISFAGMLGLLCQFYYFLARKKTLLTWILFLLVVLIPFAEVFNILRKFPFPIHLLLIALPYLIWSMLGYFHLLEEKKVRMWIIFGVLIASLWYLLSIPYASSICSLQ
jgi:hypothetical protein